MGGQEKEPLYRARGRVDLSGTPIPQTLTFQRNDGQNRAGMGWGCRAVQVWECPLLPLLPEDSQRNGGPRGLNTSP